MHRSHWTLLLVLWLTTIVAAQPPSVAWTHHYGGNQEDTGISLIPMEDGGYAFAGYTRSFPGYFNAWLLRLNAEGDTLWSRLYGGQYDDHCISAIMTTDGGFLLTGYSVTFTNGGWDYWMIKTDSNGDTLWTRHYGEWNDEECLSVVQTHDGGYALAGVTHSYTAGGWDGLLMKISANGDSLWSRKYGGAYDDWIQCVRETTDGGLILAGYSKATLTSYQKFWAIKTDASGTVEWTRTYRGPWWDQCRTVIQTDDGGYLLAGVTHPSGTGVVYDDAWMVKTAANGDSLWSRRYGGQYWDEFRDVKQLPDGGYILAGTMYRSLAGYQECYLVRTDAQGDSLWTTYVGGPLNDECWAICRNADDSYTVGGWSESPSAGNRDFWVFKTEMDHTLPVELTAFEAASSGNAIELSFTLASENGNDHFEIYRSTTQDGDYSRLANLPSQGNGSSEHHYTYLDQAVTAGQTYWYFLADVDVNGNRTEHRDLLRSATVPAGAALPVAYSLSAYPNPFNPSTTISFTLKDAGLTHLAVYDATGREIAVLSNQSYAAGEHRVNFDGKALPTGIYFVRLQSGSFVQTQKLLLLK